jgi:hypothetical protein
MTNTPTPIQRKVMKPSYLVTLLSSPTVMIPLFSRWETAPIGDKGVCSLEDANKYVNEVAEARIDDRFDGIHAYRLEDQRTNTKREVVYSFYSIPAPDSFAARNPEVSNEQYLHIKVTPRLELE